MKMRELLKMFFGPSKDRFLVLVKMFFGPTEDSFFGPSKDIFLVLLKTVSTRHH